MTSVILKLVCAQRAETGYLINTDKSQHVPSTMVCFFFFCDSLRQAFLIAQAKKTKFSTFHESILTFCGLSLKTQQHFTGQVVSFSLGIPGCKLSVHKVFNAIASLTRSSKAAAKVQGRLSFDVAC